MINNVLIREAVADDLPILLEFEQGIVSAERPMNPCLKDGEIHYYDLAQYVASRDVGVFIGEIDGKPMKSGYALICEAKDYLKHDRYAYLGFMYVRPEYRGLGLNAMIVDALVGWARSRDIYELRLDVYASNTGAIRAYEKAGFEPHLLEMRLAVGGGDNE